MNLIILHKSLWKRGICFSLFLLMVVSISSDVWARRMGGRFGGTGGFSRMRSFGSPGKGYGFGGSGLYRKQGYYPRTTPRTSFFPLPIPIFGGFGFFSPFFFLSRSFIFILLILLALFILWNFINDIKTGYSLRTPMKRRLIPGSFTVAKLQLSLLFTARQIIKELKETALRGKTQSSEDLAYLLREATILLNRYPHYWRYALWQVGHLNDLDEAEEFFHELVAQERAKLSQEKLVNIDGRIQRACSERSEGMDSASESSQEVGGYIIITAIAAFSHRCFDTIDHPTQEDIRRILIKLGAVIPQHLLAMEVIWCPEDSDAFLTEEDLLLDYPELQSL